MERVGLKTQCFSPSSVSNHLCDFKTIIPLPPCSRNGNTSTSLIRLLHQDSCWSLSPARSPSHRLSANSFLFFFYETLPDPLLLGQGSSSAVPCRLPALLAAPRTDIRAHCPPLSPDCNHRGSDPSVLRLCIWYQDQDPAREACAEWMRERKEEWRLSGPPPSQVLSEDDERVCEGFDGERVLCRGLSF